MNPIIDALMLIFFVLFMVFIFRGYHTQRLEQVEDETCDKAQEAKHPQTSIDKEDRPVK